MKHMLNSEKALTLMVVKQQACSEIAQRFCPETGVATAVKRGWFRRSSAPISL